MKKKPTKHYWQEDFCLGIPGWCLCSNCASFSLDASPCLEAGSVETQCNKSSKRKRIEGCKALKITQQECNNNQTISDNINKSEIEVGKENNDNRFPFNTTVNELEKVNVRPTQLRTLTGRTKTLNHGRTARNQRFPEAGCPDDVFSSKEVVCQWICKYITETRKAGGSEYTPHSLCLLLSSILRYVRKVYPKMQVNVFADHEFYTPQEFVWFCIQNASLQRHWSFLENSSCFVCRWWKEVMGYKQQGIAVLL